MMRRRACGVTLAVVLAIFTGAPHAALGVTICDVQEYDEIGLSPLEGQTVTVTGVVTVEPGVFQPAQTSFYIEWEGCGVNIFAYDPGLVTAAVGDTIEVTGVVTEFQSSSNGAGSTTEIAMSSWSMIAEGNGEFEPTYINLRDLAAEENEGRLCRTLGVVTVEELPYDFYINQPWRPTAEIQVYRSNPDVNMGVFAVGDTVDITGIIMQYDRTVATFFEGYELAPRYQTDMMEAVPPPRPEPEFWVNSDLRIPSRVFRPGRDEVIPIAYLAPERSDVSMEIYDLQGHRVRKLTDAEYTGYSSIPEFYKPDFYVDGTRGWDGRDELRRLVPAGAYVCRLEVKDRDGNTSVSTAPVVVGFDAGE